MAESISSTQQGASEQIGLHKPLCSDGTQLMEIRTFVQRGCGRKKKITVQWLTAYAFLVHTEVSRLVHFLSRHAPSHIYIF
jgi:hypothetical protein